MDGLVLAGCGGLVPPNRSWGQLLIEARVRGCREAFSADSRADLTSLTLPLSHTPLIASSAASAPQLPFVCRLRRSEPISADAAGTGSTRN